jgi:WD40 repeat protein
VRVLDANSGSIVYTSGIHPNGIPDVAWSPDGTRIAVGSSNGAVYLINAATGNNLYTYKGQPGSIEAVRWSPNSKLVTSGNDIGPSTGGTEQVWQAV